MPRGCAGPPLLEQQAFVWRATLRWSLRLRAGWHAGAALASCRASLACRRSSLRFGARAHFEIHHVPILAGAMACRCEEHTTRERGLATRLHKDDMREQGFSSERSYEALRDRVWSLSWAGSGGRLAGRNDLLGREARKWPPRGCRSDSLSVSSAGDHRPCGTA